MLTDCNAGQFAFEALGNRKVTAAFDGGAITSNAGALLLRQVDQRIGLSRQAASCFSDGRDQDQIEHRLETLLAQRMHGIALGYEDLNDHDELRHDPVLGLLSGKLEARRSDCAVLAGKSTLNRLEHAPEGAEDRYHKFIVDGEAMKALFINLFFRARKRLPAASSSISTPPTIRSTAIRRDVSSMATTNATAICRFMCSAAVTCFWRSCGPPISMPQPERKKRSPALSPRSARAGLMSRSGCGRIPASVARI